MLKGLAWLHHNLTLGLTAFAAFLLVCTSFVGAAIAFPQNAPVIAYSLDYKLDQARGDQTIEHYGESVREPVEQALRNNVNHPESKDTAENSYGRKSFLNNLLPKRHSLGKEFSQDDFSSMRKIVHPRDVLKENGGAPLSRALK